MCCRLAISRRDDRKMSKELSQLPRSLESKTIAPTLECSGSPPGVRARDPSLRRAQSPLKNSVSLPPRTHARQPGKLTQSADCDASWAPRPSVPVRSGSLIVDDVIVQCPARTPADSLPDQSGLAPRRSQQ